MSASGKEKRMIAWGCAALLLVTMGVGLAAAVMSGRLQLPEEGLAAWLPKETDAGEPGSVLSVPGEGEDPSGEGQLSTSEGEEPPLAGGEAEGAGGGQGVEVPQVTEPTVPPAISRPAEMRGVVVAAGRDFLLTGQEDEATLREQVAQALDAAVEMTMNTVIVDVVTAEGALYQGGQLPALSQVDLFSLVAEAAQERGLYLYAGFDARALPCDGQVTQATTLDSPVLDQLAGELAAFLQGRQLDGVLLDNYYNPDRAGSYADYLRYGGGMGYEAYMFHAADRLFERLAQQVRQLCPGAAVGFYSVPVWADASDVEGGSDTGSDQSAYLWGHSDNAGYLDTGLADFAAVRATGSLTDSLIPFGEVARWWQARGDQAGKPVYMVHSTDKAVTQEPGWTEYDQIARQVIEMRSLAGYSGSIFNDLARMREDPAEFASKLVGYYNDEVSASHILTDLTMTKPEKTTFDTFEPTVLFMGATDPNTDATINGQKIVTDENGYFAMTLELEPGENTFVITHKGRSVTYKITRIVQVIQEVTPTGAMSVDGGMKITISAIAYGDAQVYAVINGQTVAMSIDTTEQDEQLKDTVYRRFVGNYTAPAATAQVQELGNIVVYGQWDTVSDSKQGASVRVNKRIAVSDGRPVMVVADYAETFPANRLDNYSDPAYYPLPKGTVDYAISDELHYREGDNQYSYYILQSGLRVYSSDITGVEDADAVGGNVISGYSVESDGRYTYLTINTQQPVPYTARYSNSAMTFTFHYTNAGPDSMALSKNPLFSAANWSGATLTLPLIHQGGFLGYYAYYDDEGRLVLRFNNPPPVSGGDLSGAVIVIDPGHGGNDPGSLGFLAAYPERVINSQIAARLANALIARGAKVTYYNTINTTTSLQSRVAMAQQVSPHLYISVHANSAAGNSTAAGSEAYYFTPFSAPMATYAAANMSAAMETRNRGGMFGYYYVTRDTQYPSVLVETGFVSNQTEYSKLIDEDYQEAVAQSLANAVVSFFKAVGADGTTVTGKESCGSTTGGVGANVAQPGKQTTSISLSSQELEMVPGGKKSLTAQVLPTDAADRSVIWSVDDPEVVEVDDNGVLTAIAEGTAVVTATTRDSDLAASCTVTVRRSDAAVAGLALRQERVVLLPEEQVQLEAVFTPENAGDQRLDWSSGDSSVVTVDQAGRVTAVGEGEAVVTATSLDGGYTAQCTVLVTGEVDVRYEEGQSPGQLLLDYAGDTVEAGQQMEIRAVLQPEGSSATVDWQITELAGSGVVQASADGYTLLVQALAAGQVEIVATCREDSSITDRMTLTVQ